MYPDGGGVMIKQARGLGIKTPILGGDAWDDPKLHKDITGGQGTILYSVSFSSTSDEFKAKMKNKTGKDEIPAGTSNAYDNVKIIAQVFAKAGTNTDKIQDELRKVEYDGVSGHISFDENGDLKTASYIVKKIENGTSVELK
jgi:branched-chain amino acid transport system substrate-binding protein